MKLLGVGVALLAVLEANLSWVNWQRYSDPHISLCCGADTLRQRALFLTVSAAVTAILALAASMALWMGQRFRWLILTAGLLFAVVTPWGRFLFPVASEPNSPYLNTALLWTAITTALASLCVLSHRNMLTPQVAKRVAWTGLLLTVGLVGACSFKVHHYNTAFANIAVGDTQSAVLAKMGAPSYREPAGNSYARYTGYPCMSSCVTRLWWEWPLTPGMEAWSVELDHEGRVIRPYRWESP